jgi:hypothetical protein
VLVFAGRKSQQFGDAPVEIAERIGRVLLVIESHQRALGQPARAAAEIAAAVECQHGCMVEGRRIIRRRGVRAVMFHQHDPALRELRAQLQQEIGLGNGTHDGDGIHVLGLRSSQFQTSGDGMVGQAVGSAPMHAPADELRFLDGGHQFAILEDRAGGVPRMPPIPRMIIEDPRGQGTISRRSNASRTPPR